MQSQSTMPVADLARRCAEEMERYRRREQVDPACCYELFRRALLEQDDEAWAAVYSQYYRLACHWLGRAPGDLDALANEAFQRFWRALPPDRFGAFPTLDALLAYLKRSAQSTAMDARRAEQRNESRLAAVRRWQEIEAAGDPASFADQVLDGITTARLYEYVLGGLSSAQERLVFRASIEWDLKPRMIAERWPDLFHGAAEVSRVKERIFRRLQRDSELRARLGVPDGGTSFRDGGKS